MGGSGGNSGGGSSSSASGGNNSNSNSNSSVLDLEDAQQILPDSFPSFVDHHGELCMRLYELVSDSPPHMAALGVGNLYAGYLSCFQRTFYAEYASNYAHAENVIKRVSSEKSRMALFFYDAATNCGAALPDLLSGVVLHVRRVSAHLRRLSVLHSGSGQECRDVEQASAAFEKLSGDVEKALQSSVELAAWFQIRRRLRPASEDKQHLFNKHAHLLDRKRLFVFESHLPKITLTKLGRDQRIKKFKLKNIRGILFDDILLLCSGNDSRTREAVLKLHYVFELEYLGVLSPLGEGGDQRGSCDSRDGGSPTVTNSVLPTSSSGIGFLSSETRSPRAPPTKSYQFGIVSKEAGDEWVLKVSTTSVEESLQWARHLDTAINSRKQARLFGLPLKTVLAREGTTIPVLVSRSIEWLLREGANVPGLFRVNANNDTVTRIVADLERSPELCLSDSFFSSQSPHDIGGLFKRYLFSLPSPVITYELYSPLLAARRQHPYVSAALAEDIRPLLKKLPSENYQLLSELMTFLRAFARFSDVTKMSENNLAIIFAPVVMYPLNPATLLTDAVFVNDVILALIREPACFEL